MIQWRWFGKSRSGGCLQQLRLALGRRERSRSWWDEDVEVAIGERWCACRRLRWLRNSGRGSVEEVEEAWEVYKVKTLIA